MSEVFQTILGICLLLLLGLALVGQVLFVNGVGYVLVFILLPFVILAEVGHVISYSYALLKKRLSNK